jgi:hypothetical protein
MERQLIPLPRVEPETIQAWRELASCATLPNPFGEAEFVLPAARHLGPSGLVLLVVRDRAGWAACAPVVRGWRVKGVPVPHVRIWRHLYAYLAVPLVRRDVVAEASEAMGESLHRMAGPARAAIAEWVPADGRVTEGLVRGLSRGGRSTVPYRSFTRAFIERASDDGAGTGSSHPRIRRLRLAVERECGGPIELIDRSADPSAVERFLTVEASGWKSRAGTALGSRPEHAAFFREMCAGFSERGRLQAMSLEAGGRLLAMKCSLLAGDGLFYFKAAYDERYARFSVGAQLEMESIRRFRGQSCLKWIDSCADPDNDMIRRFMPRERRLVTLLGMPLGRVTGPAMRGMASVLRSSAKGGST